MFTHRVENYASSKFKNDYEHLYITEFYEHLQYKQQLPNFEFWDGKHWILFKTISRFHFSVNGKFYPVRGFMGNKERVLNNNFEPKFIDFQ